MDLVERPPHYIADKLQVIDVIDDWDLDFRLGNAAKYLLRAGRKTADPGVDLMKARWYVRRARGLPATQSSRPVTINFFDVVTSFGLPNPRAEALYDIFWASRAGSDWQFGLDVALGHIESDLALLRLSEKLAVSWAGAPAINDNA